MIGRALAERADEVLRGGGLVLFGADTVYGLAAAHDHPEAVARLIALKGRDERKPNAYIAFSLEAAAPMLAGLGPRTRAVTDRLFPGPVTLVLPGGAALRVPELAPGAQALAAVTTLAIQSSANPAGGTSPARVEDVAPPIVSGVDLVLDAGPLPGTASTVIDLSAYEESGKWSVLRQGALDPGPLIDGHETPGSAEIGDQRRPGHRRNG